MGSKMRINEIFYSLQGEGHFTGTPAIFIRFSGCNRACHFCDTDFARYSHMSAEEIIENISQYPAKHIVLTGGEPAMHIDHSFVKQLKDNGYFVQIETNGSLPLPDNIDWVTCSPKEQPWGINRVDELKIVFLNQDVESIAAYFIEKMQYAPKVFCLQPCSGTNTSETINYILSHPRWRLSLQTHKMVNIQ